MTESIKLVVGLGNPGPKYTATRHNVGAWFIKALANKYGGALKLEAKFKGHLCSIKVNENSCLLLTPTTYMNLSGQSVQAISNYYKISTENILVAQDELDFIPGIARIQKGGGSNGHNGIQNIIDILGKNDFYRLRIGIGKPEHKDQKTDYVLQTPKKNEKQLIDEAINKSLDIMPILLAGDIQEAIQILHS